MINSNLVDDFLDYMKSTKGSSDNTVKEYYYDLRVFVRFIKKRKYGKIANQPSMISRDILLLRLR